MYQAICQYRHFMYNYKLTLQKLRINPYSKEILQFYVIFFAVFNVFWIRTTMFRFDKLHFLIAVGDILEKNFFEITDSDFLVDSNLPRYQMIINYLRFNIDVHTIYLVSILLSTHSIGPITMGSGVVGARQYTGLYQLVYTYL